MILLALKIYQDAYFYFYQEGKINLAFIIIQNASLIVKQMDKINNPDLLKAAA